MTHLAEILTDILTELRGLRSDLQARSAPPVLIINPGELDIDAAEMARLAGSAFRS